MTGFNKYSRIDNSYKKRTIAYMRQHTHGELWYATEKIHGTNLSMIFHRDGTIQIGKRSGIIPKDELVSFYRADLALKMAEQSSALVNYWFGRNTDVTSVQVFGEWFGGGNKESQTPRVQKGVDYGEDLRFCAFDVRITNTDDKSHYLSLNGFVEFCVATDIAMVPMVFDNLSFDEALEYDIEGLETYLSNSGDIVEGVIIKPHNEIVLPTGSRAILKKKTKAFEEVSKTSSKKKEKVCIKFEDERLNEQIGALENYFTEPRFDNMMGNLGHGLKMPEYIKYYSSDVLKDFYDQLADDGFDEISKLDRSIIQKAVGKMTPSKIIEFGVLDFID